MLPAAATLRPGQPKTKGQERLSPHRGKLSPRDSTRGPTHQVGGCSSSGHPDRISPHFPFPGLKSWDPKAIFTPREV